MIDTDLCVIGAGSGGLSVAAGAVQMGARVVLIEKGLMGGDCLNHGCVPSKALLAAAKHAHAMTTGAPFGVSPVAPQVDYAAAKDHVRRVIEAIAPIDSQERFEGLGVRVIRAEARFVSPREVEAGGERVRARRFVLATGSRPLVPPIPGLDAVAALTNETIFELRERPDHLLVVGGGPIGMEMAQAHRRLGCAVTLLEGGRALPKDDPELAAVVIERLREEGVRIEEGAQVARVERTGGDGGGDGGANGGANGRANGGARIRLHAQDGRAFEGTHLLIAVGRRVTLEGLGLDAAGIAHTARGLTLGDDLRTTNRRVYAVGDVAGRMQFTHAAGYHAGVVIRQAVLGLPARAREDHIPWATYTDPELAQVGLSEPQARARHGRRLEVARFAFHENDRAQAERATGGLIKVMVVKGRPVGASIVGAGAGDLIGLWALALANRLKMSQIAGMVAPYPTLGEVSKRAAGAYFAPRLFENATLSRAVRTLQRWLP